MPTETTDHTPGPWRVNGCELIGDSTVLATLCWHSGRDAENQADYALIAAAPDLLEALLNVRSLISEAAAAGFNYKDGDWPERLYFSQQKTSAAIEKARRVQK